MANEKTPFTFIQNAQGVVIKIRVGGVEIPVVRAAPTPGRGQMDAVVTFGNIDPSVEVEEVKDDVGS